MNTQQAAGFNPRGFAQSGQCSPVTCATSSLKPLQRRTELAYRSAAQRVFVPLLLRVTRPCGKRVVDLKPAASPCVSYVRSGWFPGGAYPAAQVASAAGPDRQGGIKPTPDMGARFR